MEHNSVDDTGMDLDLNLEPVDPPVGSVLGFGSLLNELESAHGRIEERIRQLEAVTVRARLRPSWRQVRTSVETNTVSSGPMINVDIDGGMHNVPETGVVAERNEERGKGCKRDSSHLVAKALEMDSEVKKKAHEDGGSFFDCNICLYMAREPILTCCGHLFCWACFYKLPFVDSTTKECPVCKGEVAESTTIPIYGNGDSTWESKLESETLIPPRPKAQRVESVRQQRVTRGVSHIPVAEALRRIRTSIGVMGDNPMQEESGSVNLSFGTSSQEFPNEEAAGVRRLRSRQFSRVLSESAASLSSISSALNSAERLVEDLETYINHRLLQRSAAQFLSIDDGDSITRNAAVSQPEGQTSTEEISSVLPLPSSSRVNDISNDAEQMENPTTSAASGLNLPPPRSSSSSRRRSGSSRVLDMENGVSHEPRRRRLN